MNLKKASIFRLIKAVLFIALTAYLLVFLTYLFRNTTKNQRMNILSYYMEDRDTIDVVSIGASTTYCYWSPLRAWETEGVPSFTYACASMRGIAMIPAIEDVLSKQKPKLLILDGRRFLDIKMLDQNDYIRYYVDSLDVGLPRFKAVHRYCKAYSIPFAEALTLYFDLCLYHNNKEAIEDPLHWELADNRLDKPSGRFMKGFILTSKVKAMKTPEGTESTEKAELSEFTEQYFRELMEYCSGLDCKVMIVISPYIIKEKEMKCFNTLEEIASEYGIPFWNASRDFDKIGLDTESDFYDRSHMNLKGAEKYTDYLLAMIKDQYGLTDHRGEEKYEEWDKALKKYKRRRKRLLKKISKKVKEQEKQKT